MQPLHVLTYTNMSDSSSIQTWIPQCTALKSVDIWAGMPEWKMLSNFPPLFSPSANPVVPLVSQYTFVPLKPGHFILHIDNLFQ